MNKTAAAAVGLGVLLLLAAAMRGDLLAALPADAAPVDLGDDGAEQGQGGAVQDAAALLAALDVMPESTPDDMGTRNTAAFLATIRAAEGTAGPNGYRTLFGGRLFDDMSDHPRRAVQFTDKAGRTLWTTAAGAYQFMCASPIPGGGSTKVDTWGRIAARLGLPDFTPASQDAAAVELIREAGALGDVQAGRFDAAVSKVRRVWASLPGAGYSQPERSIDSLRTVYADAGGIFA